MDKTVKWYDNEGKDIDVVGSTRVRLARNIKGYPFPKRATMEQKQDICQKVKTAVLSANGVMDNQFSFIPLDKLSDVEAVSLVEKHIVSPEFISDLRGKLLILSSDESISIMVNEEDHLRIQVIEKGNDINKAYEIADKVDTLLNESLKFAFDNDYGYLTQCPTNIGTAMRVSLLLHLPALTETGAITRIKMNMEKLSMTIRGTYGEGTDIIGAVYQLSNQITLGLSENEAIENLALLSQQIINEERACRDRLKQDIGVQDRILRSVGVLKSARVLSAQEFAKLMAYARLGENLGMMTGSSLGELDRLDMRVQPATLMGLNGAMSEEERDIKRAQIVRDVFTKIDYS